MREKIGDWEIGDYVEVETLSGTIYRIIHLQKYDMKECNFSYGKVITIRSSEVECEELDFSRTEGETLISRLKLVEILYG